VGPTTDLPITASHPFYRRLNQLLGEHRFDEFVERSARAFMPRRWMGRPSLPPTIYLRLLLIGYLEGIESGRGIACEPPIRWPSTFWPWH
jgi:transposase